MTGVPTPSTQACIPQGVAPHLPTPSAPKLGRPACMCCNRGHSAVVCRVYWSLTYCIGGLLAVWRVSQSPAHYIYLGHGQVLCVMQRYGRQLVWLWLSPVEGPHVCCLSDQVSCSGPIPCSVGLTAFSHDHSCFVLAHVQVDTLRDVLALAALTQF